MKKALSVIMILAFAISLMSVATFTSAAEDVTLIYKIDFEEENAGTVMKANGELVGEVVEWPAGSGNHALKYIMDSTTYKSNGVHPYIVPTALGGALAVQGEIPAGGELYFTVSVGCDDELVTGNSEYGLYMYAMMLTADEGENYFANETGTFVPGVGSFKTGEFSLANYEVTPVAGTGNGLIALLDDGTLGAGMPGKAIYYDDITLEWYGAWTPVTDALLCYQDTMVPIANSDINDAYTGTTPPPVTPSKDDPQPSKDDPQPSQDEPGTMGDANADGEINLKDVLIIRKAIAGMNPTGYVAASADFNDDGEVNLKDVLALRKSIANIK